MPIGQPPCSLSIPNHTNACTTCQNACWNEMKKSDQHPLGVWRLMLFLSFLLSSSFSCSFAWTLLPTIEPHLYLQYPRPIEPTPFSCFSCSLRFVLVLLSFPVVFVPFVKRQAPHGCRSDLKSGFFNPRWWACGRNRSTGAVAPWRGWLRKQAEICEIRSTSKVAQAHTYPPFRGSPFETRFHLNLNL